MVTTNSWLQIIDDPAQIERAKESFQRSIAEQLEQVFATLAERTYFFSEHQEILERDRAASCARLRALLPKQGTIAANAALLLCRLHDEQGRAFAVRLLKQGTVEQRKLILRGLGDGFYGDEDRARHLNFLFAEQELSPALLAPLDDPSPEIVAEAIHKCCWLKVPGAHQRFLAMLKRGDSAAPDRLLYALSQGELTEELFDLAVARSAGVNLENAGGTAIFEAFAKAKAPELRAKGKVQLRKILAGWPEDGNRGYSGTRLGVLSALCEAAGPDDLEWLLKLAQDEAGHYAGAPLQAYCRLAPAEGKQMLLAWLKSDAKRSPAVTAATKCFVGTADAELVEGLSKIITKNANDRGISSVCEALQAIGGPEAEKQVAQFQQRLEPASAAHMKQSTSTHTLEDVAEAVLSADLLVEAELAAAVKEMRADDPKRVPQLFDLLYVAKSALVFDVETGKYPNRHDELVEQFAKASRGRFVPEAILEITHRQHEDDYESPYTLQFVAGGRLFRAEIRSLGDWYDVERVAAMINMVLAQQGNDERFLCLAADGQIASFVFANPERLKPVAERFNMVLSTDLASAMRQGNEFEEEVRRSYRQPR